MLRWFPSPELIFYATAKTNKKTHFNLILGGEVCRLHVGVSGGGVMLCKWNQALEQQPGVCVSSATLESHFLLLWGGLSFLICKTVHWMRNS